MNNLYYNEDTIKYANDEDKYEYFLFHFNDYTEADFYRMIDVKKNVENCSKNEIYNKVKTFLNFNDIDFKMLKKFYVYGTRALWIKIYNELVDRMNGENEYDEFLEYDNIF